MQYKHIIFDFDGVLVDSFDFHLNHVNELFKLAISSHEYKAIHDGNFYEKSSDTITSFDQEKYANHVASAQKNIPLRDGFENLLKDLSTKSSMYLVTSGSRLQIEPFLEHNNIKQYFTDCLYKDHHILKSEKFQSLFQDYDFKAGEAIFVTDTVGDIHEAYMVGLESIAVSFGFHEKERLIGANPKLVVDSIDELSEALDGYIRLNA